MDIEAFFDKKQFNENKFKIEKRLKRHIKVRERLFSILDKIRKNKNPRVFISNLIMKSELVSAH